MIESILLSDVVDRVAPPEIVVSLAVVGQVVYLGVYEHDETNTDHHFKIIERPLTDDEKKKDKSATPIQAKCALDLGDLVQAVALLNESQDRLARRVRVETEHANKRAKSIEVELAEQTATAANKRFTDLYEKHEQLSAEAKVLREEIERAQTELRGAKWKLAEELHRQGRGPAPDPQEVADG